MLRKKAGTERADKTIKGRTALQRDCTKVNLEIAIERLTAI